MANLSGRRHKTRHQELVPFGPNAPLSEYDHPRNPDDGVYTLDGFIAMPGSLLQAGWV